jgi:hypothetical protein
MAWPLTKHTLTAGIRQSAFGGDGQFTGSRDFIPARLDFAVETVRA